MVHLLQANIRIERGLNMQTILSRQGARIRQVAADPTVRLMAGFAKKYLGVVKSKSGISHLVPLVSPNGRDARSTRFDAFVERASCPFCWPGRTRI